MTGRCHPLPAETPVSQLALLVRDRKEVGNTPAAAPLKALASQIVALSNRTSSNVTVEHRTASNAVSAQNLPLIDSAERNYVKMPRVTRSVANSALLLCAVFATVIITYLQRCASRELPDCWQGYLFLKVAAVVFAALANSNASYVLRLPTNCPAKSNGDGPSTTKHGANRGAQRTAGCAVNANGGNRAAQRNAGCAANANGGNRAAQRSAGRAVNADGGNRAAQRNASRAANASLDKAMRQTGMTVKLDPHEVGEMRGELQALINTARRSLATNNTRRPYVNNAQRVVDSLDVAIPVAVATAYNRLRQRLLEIDGSGKM